MLFLELKMRCIELNPPRGVAWNAHAITPRYSISLHPYTYMVHVIIRNGPILNDIHAVSLVCVRKLVAKWSDYLSLIFKSTATIIYHALAL